MIQTVGAIKAPRMIWAATITSLGSLLICWITCNKNNPTILDTTLQYPYTIIFRVGMMYSLFLFFMELLFIKWWLDSSQLATNTRMIAIIGGLGLASYGMFVSCIDRKRINYPFARGCSFFANICFTIALMIIMKNLKRIVKQTSYRFITERSYYYKRIFSFVHLAGFSIGLWIYLGFGDIYYKPLAEYTIVISSALFLCTFTIDFKKFTMDIDNIPKTNNQFEVANN